jgi:hypothetical protein
VAEYAPPAQALAVVLPQINALVRAQVPGAPEARFLRVIAERPARLPNWDQAAWIHWEHTLGDDVQQAFSLVGVTPSTQQMWLFYFSSASAPKARFDRLLPLMMRIWGSWRISQRELADRLRRARKAQEEAIAIVDQVVRHRDRVFDEIHAKWVEYIRDEATIRDVETGENRTVDVAAGDVRDWVNVANHAAGFERWEVLSPTRINGRG